MSTQIKRSMTFHPPQQSNRSVITVVENSSGDVSLSIDGGPSMRIIESEKFVLSLLEAVELARNWSGDPL